MKASFKPATEDQKYHPMALTIIVESIEEQLALRRWANDYMLYADDRMFLCHFKEEITKVLPVTPL